MDNSLVKTETALPSIPTELDAEAMVKAIGMNDVTSLSPAQRVNYIGYICKSIGLNAATWPIRILKIDGRDVLYATAECASQLGKRDGATTEVLEEKIEHGCYRVKVRAKLPSGRTHDDVALVPILFPAKVKEWTGSSGNRTSVWKDHPRAGQPMDGVDYANAVMKAYTKAERRAILKICGLGIPDESELDYLKPANVTSVSSLPHVTTADDRVAELESLTSSPAATPQTTPETTLVAAEVISAPVMADSRAVPAPVGQSGEVREVTRLPDRPATPPSGDGIPAAEATPAGQPEHTLAQAPAGSPFYDTGGHITMEGLDEFEKRCSARGVSGPEVQSFLFFKSWLKKGDPFDKMVPMAVRGFFDKGPKFWGYFEDWKAKQGK